MDKLLLAPGPHFTVFGQDIYFYGVVIVCGMIAALVMLGFLFKKFGIKTDAVYNYALIIIPVAVICARAMFVISEGGSFFDFKSGGLSIMGGLVGGIIMLCVAAILQKHRIFHIGDLAVPCVAVAQAIGRWGNFLNKELYGQQIFNPSWQWFPAAVEVGGKYYMALFFYEMLWNLVGAGIMLFLIFKFYRLKDGATRNGLIFGTYCIWYGGGRFWLEGLRQPEFIMGTDGFQTSRFICALLLVLGAAALCYALWLRPKIQPFWDRVLNRPLTAAEAAAKPPEQSEDEKTDGQ